MSSEQTSPGQRVGARKVVRRDPTIHRDVQGINAMSMLENEDPNKSYVIVARNGIHPVSRADYEMRGYDVEMYAEGGVRPRGMRGNKIRVGEPIEVVEGYLMSIDKAALERVNASGIARMDAISTQMRTNVGDFRVQGISNRYVRETSAWGGEGGDELHGES